MHRPITNTLRFLFVAVAFLALAAAPGCRGSGPKLGINGNGIDIRPIGAVSVRYTRQPSNETSPFETLDLDFAITDDSDVALRIGDASIPVNRKHPARLRYQVISGARKDTFQLVVLLPNTTHATVPPSSGRYDASSTFVAPAARPNQNADDGDVLVVNLHGLESEIRLQH